MSIIIYYVLIANYRIDERIRYRLQTDGADGKHPRRYRELHGGRKVFLANREQPKLHDTDARGAIRNGMWLGSYVHLRR